MVKWKVLASSLALMFLISLSVSACGAKKPPPPGELRGAAPGAAAPSEPTLYDRLGGKAGVDAIADTFLNNLVADARVSAFFKNSKGLSQFRQQLCQLSGGPCRYTGKEMKAAHGGMRINDTQFDAFLDDLRLALDEKRVSNRDKSELLAALTPMRTDIVEKKGQGE